MSFRSAILMLAVLANFSAIDGHIMSFPEDELTHENRGDKAPKVKCAISANNVEWSSRSAESSVSVHIQFEGAKEISVTASLQLTALPKGHGLGKDEYWAPFDAASGRTTKGSQTLRAPDERYNRSVQLVPTQLFWASTKSSVWPSDDFAKTVPPGPYSLQVQLELTGGATIKSNEITINVVK